VATIRYIVDDVDATVAELRDAGLHFRNEIVTGSAVASSCWTTPSGNAVELLESARA
jgi:hypothetical protein